MTDFLPYLYGSEKISKVSHNRAASKKLTAES
jgi:hypothetical protein